MAIPESIKKLANDIRTKVYGREVRESLAKGIEEAGDIANLADIKADAAVEQVDNIQAQVNQLVVEGDSSVEAAQARVDAKGKSYPTLKARLDAKETEFSSQLAEAEQNIADLDQQKADKNEIVGTSVKIFGDTNDSTTIQAALNFAETIGGATIFIPSGEYSISQTLQIPSNTKLIGVGNVVLKRTSDINAMIINKSTGTVGGYDASENIHIQNIIIDANMADFPTNVTPIGIGHAKQIAIKNVHVLNVYGWHAVELNAVKDAIIDQCYFKNQNAATGFEMVQLDLMLSDATFPWFGPYDLTPCENITIKDSVFEGGVDGIGSHSAATGARHTNIKIINCKFINMSGKAVKPYNYNDCHVINNYFENCDYAIENTNYDICYGFLARGNYIKNMATRGIHLKNGSYNSKIIENYVEGSGVHGITVDTSDDVEIASNTSINNGQAGIWAYACSNARIRGNHSIGNDKSITGIRYDIMVGINTQQIGNKNLVSDNTCNTLQYGQLSNSCITNNNVTQLLVYGYNTNVTAANNMINGVWTP